MDVPELLNEAPNITLALVGWLVLAAAGLALLVAVFDKPERKLVRNAVLATGLLIMAVGANGAVASLSAHGEQSNANHRAYEAALFDRYGLAPDSWDRAGEVMPSWKDVTEAGKAGVASRVHHGLEGSQDVRIILDGSTLTVTGPGGGEITTAAELSERGEG